VPTRVVGRSGAPTEENSCAKSILSKSILTNVFLIQGGGLRLHLLMSE